MRASWGDDEDMPGDDRDCRGDDRGAGTRTVYDSGLTRW